MSQSNPLAVLDLKIKDAKQLYLTYSRIYITNVYSGGASDDDFKKFELSLSRLVELLDEQFKLTSEVYTLPDIY